MKENIIKEKSYKFATEVVNFVRGLPRDIASYTLGKQLIRSGTSIGANIEEATGSISKDEFIYKMGIALKEARETCYWIRIIKDAKIGKNDEVKSLLDKAEELAKISSSIVKTSRENRDKQLKMEVCK